MTEVAGLIRIVLTPFRWLWTWVLLVREVKTHKQEILTDRDLLERELRQNARLLEEHEQGKWSVGHMQTMLRTVRWHQTASKWSVLRRRNQAT